MWWYGLYSSGSGYGSVEGSCEHSNERSGSQNFGEVLISCATGCFLRRARLKFCHVQIVLVIWTETEIETETETISLTQIIPGGYVDMGLF
jgi:hypothetical protein